MIEADRRGVWTQAKRTAQQPVAQYDLVRMLPSIDFAGLSGTFDEPVARIPNVIVNGQRG